MPTQVPLSPRCQMDRIQTLNTRNRGPENSHDNHMHMDLKVRENPAAMWRVQRFANAI